MVSETTWRNEYGSLMRLREGTDGCVRGLYRSTTGSSGDYHVTGFIEPAAIDGNHARALSLGISWRAIDGDDEEPGSQWVSGLSGQLLHTPQGPRLLLMHNLVVSTHAPAPKGTGFHLDKLQYEPTGESLPLLSLSANGTAIDPTHLLGGAWVSTHDDSLRLELSVTKEGEVLGAMTEGDAEPGPIRGYADALASNNTPTLHGVSLTGWSAQRRCAYSLAGWLTVEGTELCLLDLSSSATDHGSRYLQTQAQGMRFRRLRT
ncbi:MAG: hypothetical protein J0I96_16905 [Rhodanobacter sp.]|nr:hypothetical protein [Rhodanobacter sp.]